jgi:hypothetical protein
MGFKPYPMPNPLTRKRKPLTQKISDLCAVFFFLLPRFFFFFFTMNAGRLYHPAATSCSVHEGPPFTHKPGGP